MDNILFTLLFDKKIRSCNFYSVLLHERNRKWNSYGEVSFGERHTSTISDYTILTKFQLHEGLKVKLSEIA